MELGAVPSTGSVGDSYDKAMAEAINALYKTELIRARGPWRTVERVELATLEGVWWKDQRLHSELEYRTPIEAEHQHYAEAESLLEATACQENNEERNPGRLSSLLKRVVTDQFSSFVYT